MDQYHAQFLKTLVACSAGTHTMTLADIAPAAQDAVPLGELAAREGPEELDLVLATFALLTTQSVLLSHGISRQLQPLVALPYSLLLIHQ